jgi:hypothetical protein
MTMAVAVGMVITPVVIIISPIVIIGRMAGVRPITVARCSLVVMCWFRDWRFLNNDRLFFLLLLAFAAFTVARANDNLKGGRDDTLVSPDRRSVHHICATSAHATALVF